jgi:NAD(P)-dependent dehydrogenase (short-subunit alcohol dehydrogenase family)
MSTPVAIVTGTSRGIGQGIAARLIASGMRVFGVSRTPGDGLGLQCDLTAPGASERVLAAVLEDCGRVDALVNNAGLLLEGNCWEQPDEDVDAMLALNLTVPFLLSQAVAAHWVNEGQRGTIVNVCSIESQVGWADPPQAAYAATKGGLLGLTRHPRGGGGARGDLHSYDTRHTRAGAGDPVGRAPGNAGERGRRRRLPALRGGKLCDG